MISMAQAQFWLLAASASGNPFKFIHAVGGKEVGVTELEGVAFKRFGKYKIQFGSQGFFCHWGVPVPH